MKIVQVKCPGCGQAIYQKTKDQMFLCQNCGKIHYRDDQGPHNVPSRSPIRTPELPGSGSICRSGGFAATS